jgi:hypothetical protein
MLAQVVFHDPSHLPEQEQGHRSLMAGRKRKAGQREPNGDIQRRTANAGLPFVYFVGARDGRVKIGRSRQGPRDRIDALQTGSADDLELLGRAVCRTEIDAKNLERLIHSALTKQGRHIRGEWFRLTRPEVDALETNIRNWAAQ